MDFFMGWFVGFTTGWIVEWAFDLVFWRQQDKKLEKKLILAEAKNDKLEAELAHAEEEAAQWAAAEREVARLEQELQRAKTTIIQLQTGAEHLRAEVAQEETVEQEQRKQLTAAEQETAVLKGDLDKAKATIIQLQTGAEHLKAELGEGEKEANR